MKLYDSAGGFRDGVTGLVEDEAQMAQKTDYHLEYRSKFNQI